MVLEVISSLCDDVVNLIEKGMAEGPANMREACITNHWNAILDLLMYVGLSFALPLCCTAHT